jgi:hypothetical protein
VNEDAMSDIFQEVEEEVRRERFEQLWKKYGNYFIAAAAALVLAVGGFEAWKAYDLNQRQQVSDRYQAAQALAASGKAPEAEAAFLALSSDRHDGYATLAKFHLAGAYLAEGKRDQAVALLRELTQYSDPEIANAARLRLAWTEADARPRPEIETILQPLTAMDSPWRFPAAEVLAYVDLKSGSRTQAEDEYQKLSQELEASAGLRQRAAAIVQYLKANPAGGAAATPAAPAPAGQGSASK